MSRDLTKADVPHSLVEAIERRVGMGHEYWDAVNPQELVAAVLNCAREHTERMWKSTSPNGGIPEEIASGLR